MADKAPAGIDQKQYDIRMEYERTLPKKEAGEDAHRRHWDKYRQDMGKADPKVRLYPDQWKSAFPEKYPEYGENPPQRYYKGGSVKHGSSTCVKSRVKG